MYAELNKEIAKQTPDIVNISGKNIFGAFSFVIKTEYQPKEKEKVAKKDKKGG